MEEVQTQVGVGDAVQNQMGDVGDKNIGLVELGLERSLPLALGLEDVDGVADEFSHVG